MPEQTPYQYQGQKELEDDVERACEKNCDGLFFLPFDKLTHFVTKETIESALTEARVGQLEGLVDFVLNRAMRVFLILAVMGKLSMLKTFRDDGIDDSSLPIEMGQRNCGYSLEKATQQQPYAIFKTWEWKDRVLFKDHQGYLTAPIFDDTFRFRFHRQRNMPYLYDPDSAKTGTSSGFFGEVSRKEIHPAHIPVLAVDINTKSVSVAVKEAKNAQGNSGFPEKEARNLHQLVLSQYESHHLIKPIAAYEIIDTGRYLMFPWADGGHLENYWKSHAEGPLSPKNAQWIIGEFAGLFEALAELHASNCRHGDLKPENILWFKNEGQGGRLQIADLGLATFHQGEDTEKRVRQAVQTTTPSGTFRYEPPEEDERRNAKSPRPRAYDIWSMGCTLLELLIWLVYGGQGLTEFRWRTKRYFWSVTYNAEQPYIIDPEVGKFMSALAANPKMCGGCRDLLELVRSRLLCIPVAKKYHEGSNKHRAIASEAHAKIQKIFDRCRDDNSYLTREGLDRSLKLVAPGVVYKDGNALVPPIKPGLPKGGAPIIEVNKPSEELNENFRLERKATEIANSQPRTLQHPQMTVHDKYDESQSSKLTDAWEVIANNEFAFHVINLLGWERVKPDGSESKASLCSSCSAIDSTHPFESTCDLSRLKTTSHTCDLCRLLLKALEDLNYGHSGFINLRQTGGIIGVENGPALLSLYAEPGPTIPDGGQLGFPKLFKHASPEQLTVMKEWIRLCDKTHDMCRRNNPHESPTMPTRLVQVDHPICLVATSSISPSRYAALSHCWGVLKDTERFCAYKSNIKQLQEFIDAESLPRTFRDAVTITRSLGLKYIWIDSLCIIQDDEDDWENESTKMEQVFSAAYLTIGVSSARSSLEGFLAERPRRPCVRVQTKSAGVIYACTAIDDFYHDVELGELNKRGWVLQERALSRRSIYFTSTQVYWECGAGVFCETLALLRNNKAAFLGDANFPKLALDYYRDGRQVLIQDLYERYSALAFTRSSDRAVAILGLQKRLERAFRTQATFGFFATYFARGLLWKRGQIGSMKRIVQPPGRFVPSWSWLSMEGSIRYMELQFEKINWATTTDFKSPFIQCQTSVTIQSSGDMAILPGLARRLHLAQLEILTYVIFDTEEAFEIGNLRCVVIGRDKVQADAENMRLHVLVIRQVSNNGEPRTYQRVGVASLSAKHVDNEGDWVRIF